MTYGLSSKDYIFLQNSLIEPLKQLQAQVYLFGSRATGKYKKFSDVDLLYIPNVNNAIPDSTIYSLLLQIENSSFPYKVDLVKYSDLAKSYKENVDASKIKL